MSEILKWYFDLPSDHEGIRYFEGEFPFPVILDKPYFSLTTVDNRVIHKRAGTTEPAFFKRIVPNDLGKKKINGRKKRRYYQANYIIKDEHFPNVNVRNARSTYQSLKKAYTKTGKLTVRNTAPYAIKFATDYQYTRDSSHTRGWFFLDVGEEKTFIETFKGIQPNFNVYAQSTDRETEFVKSIFGLSWDHPGVRYFQPHKEDEYTLKSIHDTRDFSFLTHRNEEYIRVAETYPVQFKALSSEKVGEGVYESDHTIVDQSFPSIYMDRETLKGTEASKVYAQKAKVLRASFERQIEYDQEIKSFEENVPFILGLNTTDHNGNSSLGITIDRVHYEENILGDEFPFKPGDVITAFNNQPVFGNKELTVLLNRHARSLDGGIGKPIPFTLTRNGNQYTGETLYFFNPYYRHWPKNEGWKAFWYKIADAFFYGFDEDIYRAFLADDPADAWEYVQNQARLNQFYSKSSIAGTVVGAFLSPGKLLLQRGVTRGISKMGMKRGVAGLVTATALEAGEEAIWSIGNRSPVLTDQEFVTKMAENMALGAGLGFAIASWNLVRK